METKLEHLSVPSSEITPKSLYLSRRDWLKTMGIVSATAFLAACKVPVGGAPSLVTAVPGEGGSGSGLTDELGAAANSFEEITNYNNYYEFTTDKQGVAPLSADFQDHALGGGSRWAGAQAKNLCHGRPAEIRAG